MAPAPPGMAVASSPPTPSSPSAMPLAAAPENVFRHAAGTAWTNTYALPIEYTVEIHSDLLEPSASDVLATRFMPDGMRRRFCVVDDEVDRIYGEKIRAYFAAHQVELKVVVVKGEEENKKFAAVETIFNDLCDFGLLRREPIFGIGGGCVLDIVGFAASCYRRGVPYVRIPTTLLGIVDASVGVKCGVDWEHPTRGGLKNRMGSFYPPCAAFLDHRFIGSQDERNVINGMGEIVKLAVVRSPELFELLELHGKRLVGERFQGGDDVGKRVIELSIQIMLEELGPNLWEHVLERCVDYGHTFSKILEMSAAPAIMHGEAVAVDGMFCVILSERRGWISRQTRDRIFKVMRDIGLPTWHPDVTLKLMSQGVIDGIEHRHGSLRMPLVKGDIGGYGFAQECGEEELGGAIADLQALHLDSCVASKPAVRGGLVGESEPATIAR